MLARSLVAGLALGLGSRAQTPQNGTNGTVPGRLGSFLVLGDWGWDWLTHGNHGSKDCQQSIADQMARTMAELGDVRFVVNVGDSFYPNGVASKEDPQWEHKWRRVYSQELRSVPWYSIYGNHDYHTDPCACSPDAAACAQVNVDRQNLDHFYMPNTSWFLEHPELGLEVVALDLNYPTWVDHTCLWTPCPEACRQNLKSRSDAAFALFYERMAASTARNVLVFSHYPTDYFWGYPEFLAELSNGTRHHIEYFGGHRHNVDNTSTTSIAPNNNWLVGGGGGWGCDGDRQGFLVGELLADGSVATREVLVDASVCCSGAWWWRQRQP